MLPLRRSEDAMALRVRSVVVQDVMDCAVMAVMRAKRLGGGLAAAPEADRIHDEFPNCPLSKGANRR